MSITKQPPRTVVLTKDCGVHINTAPAGVSLTPGYLLKLYSNAGVATWKAHDSADGIAQTAFANDQSQMNLGVDSAYNVGDEVDAFIAARGCGIWALIASGVAVVPGSLLSSAGDGTLHVGTSNIVAVADETVTAAHTGLTRVRVTVV